MHSSARIRGRGSRWAIGTSTLLAQLSDEQKTALQRARAGYPPGFLLGWHNQPDTGHAPDTPLKMMDEVARALLRGYAWQASGFVDDLDRGEPQAIAPDWRPIPGRSRIRYNVSADCVCPRYDGHGTRIEGGPDIRHEALSVIEIITETRASIDGGHIEAALLRMMTLGTLFGRMASMLLDGPSIARGAVNVLCRAEMLESRDERTREKLSPRNEYILWLDEQTTGRVKSERAKAIKRGWTSADCSKRFVGLDAWVVKHNANLKDNRKVRTISADEISRMLPSR